MNTITPIRNHQYSAINLKIQNKQNELNTNYHNNEINLNNIPHYPICFNGNPLKKIPLNFDIIDSLSIDRLRRVNESTIAGPTFSLRPKEDLVKLKEAGIKHIVDFRAEAGLDFEQQCKNLGIDYFRFPLDYEARVQNSPFFYRTPEGESGVLPDFIQGLKKFVGLVDGGNTYYGCRHGIDRTNIGSLLYYIFSKDATTTPKILNWQNEHKKTVLNKDIKIIRKIIRKLTPEQRAELGIDESFDMKLANKITKVLVKNYYNES